MLAPPALKGDSKNFWLEDVVMVVAMMVLTNEVFALVVMVMLEKVREVYLETSILVFRDDDGELLMATRALVNDGFLSIDNRLRAFIEGMAERRGGFGIGRRIGFLAFFNRRLISCRPIFRAGRVHDGNRHVGGRLAHDMPIMVGEFDHARKVVVTPCPAC